MKYARILETLTVEPLLITPGARDALLKLFEDHARMTSAEWAVRLEAAQRTGVGPCGEKVELESMTVDDRGIAHIPIGGPLGMKLGGFEKGAGAVDFLDIQRDLAEADADAAVKGIILHFDSPGGTVSGTPETADKIQAVDKPIFAWSEGGTIASAAYWLASAADGIWTTRSALVGSIGVYTAYLDMSEMARMRGIKVKMFSSGKYKGMGQPGTALTEAQESYIMEHVLNTAQDFYDHVRQQRGDVPDEVMQGQVFRAPEALNAGLVDEIVGDVGTLVDFLS